MEPNDYPSPEGERSAAWIPVNPLTSPPPPDWKPEAPFRGKGGTPAKNAQGQPAGMTRLGGHLGGIEERIRKLSQRSDSKSRILTRSQEMMDACTKGAEPCVTVQPDGQALATGFVEVPGADGKPIVGARFQCNKKTIFCKHGAAEYVIACKQYLLGMRFQGKLAEACFLREREHPSMVEGGNPFIRDQLSKEVYAWAVEGGWKKNPLLILHGKTGPGKTHCALAAMAHLKVQHQLEGKVFNAVRLFRGNGTRDAMLDEAMGAQVLILDDMGQEVNSDVNRSNLYMVIDSRIASYMPTIITTNLMIDEIVQHYDEQRIDDRLLTFHSVTTNLPSKRLST
jgi:hypothetical protein